MTAPDPELKITVNGESRAVPPGSTVADLLAELGLDSGPVAVEQNRALVRKADHPATALVDGDDLEIVTFLGGG